MRSGIEGNHIVVERNRAGARAEMCMCVSVCTQLCVCVYTCAQLCPTLCDTPMDCSPPDARGNRNSLQVQWTWNVTENIQWPEKLSSRTFPGGSVAKTSLPDAGGEGSIPGRGAKIPCLAAKTPEHKNYRSQYCNKFNRLKKLKKKQNLGSGNLKTG